MRTIEKVTDSIREALAQSERALRPLAVAQLLANRLSSKAETYDELAERKKELREMRAFILDAQAGVGLASTFLTEADEMSAVDREERQALAAAEADLLATMTEVAQRNTRDLTARADEVYAQLGEAEKALDRKALARKTPKDQLLAALICGGPVV